MSTRYFFFAEDQILFDQPCMCLSSFPYLHDSTFVTKWKLIKMHGYEQLLRLPSGPESFMLYCHYWYSVGVGERKKQSVKLTIHAECTAPHDILSMCNFHLCHITPLPPICSLVHSSTLSPILKDVSLSHLYHMPYS